MNLCDYEVENVDILGFMNVIEFDGSCECVYFSDNHFASVMHQPLAGKELQGFVNIQFDFAAQGMAK